MGEAQTQRRIESTEPSSVRESSEKASRALLADSGAWSNPTTRLDGKDCKTPAGPNDIPFLPQGKATPGCQYLEFGKAPSYLADHYKDAKETLAHIRTDMKAGPDKFDLKGSGVIMGHGKDVTYVATVNHNTESGDDKPGKAFTDSRGFPVLRDGPIKVQMPNGKEYDARRATLKGEDGQDRSVLVVHTGDDTGKFKEAQFSDQPNYKGKGFVMGFPQESKTPYVSTFQGQGESMNRPSGGEKMLTGTYKGHSEGGLSGGPMYDEKGRVFSLDEGADQQRPYSTMYGVRFGQKEVDRWKKVLPESW